MNVSSQHPDLERLSSYLDSELLPDEHKEIELHLEECGACRRELDGLRRVVGGLHQLPRLAPPPLMDSVILQQISIEAARRRTGRHQLLRLLEASGRANVAIGFALVFSLAVIVYIFATALESTTEIVVPPSDSVRFSTGAEGALAEIEGRRFHKRGEIWWQDGADVAENATTVSSERRQELLLRYPWLQALVVDAEEVWFLSDGEVIGIQGALPRSPERNS